MNEQRSGRVFAIAAVVLPALLLSISALSSKQTNTRQNATAAPLRWTAVPKATCGRLDRTEGGLQGQTTPGERSSGKSEGGYNCNLELVGQFQGEGAYSQDGPAFLTNCAYFATENRSGLKHAGVVVLDVSDPQHPQRPRTWTTLPRGGTRTRR